VKRSRRLFLIVFFWTAVVLGAAWIAFAPPPQHHAPLQVEVVQPPPPASRSKSRSRHSAAVSRNARTRRCRRSRPFTCSPPQLPGRLWCRAGRSTGFEVGGCRRQSHCRSRPGGRQLGGCSDAGVADDPHRRFAQTAGGRDHLSQRLGVRQAQRGPLGHQGAEGRSRGGPPASPARGGIEEVLGCPADCHRPVRRSPGGGLGNGRGQSRTFTSRGLSLHACGLGY